MPLPQTTHCTYADYLTWDTEQKYELFDGVPVMQARPSIQHQNIEAHSCSSSVTFWMVSPAALLPRLRFFSPTTPTRAQTM